MILFLSFVFNDEGPNKFGNKDMEYSIHNQMLTWEKICKPCYFWDFSYKLRVNLFKVARMKEQETLVLNKHFVFMACIDIAPLGCKRKLQPWRPTGPKYIRLNIKQKQQRSALYNVS